MFDVKIMFNLEQCFEVVNIFDVISTFVYVFPSLTRVRIRQFSEGTYRHVRR